MAKFTFQCIAIDETAHWCLDPDSREASALKFGIYLIRPDERVHICSLTPSARADWLRNEFVMSASWDDPVWEDISELENENGGEWVTYFDWHSIASKGDEYKSETYVANVNIRDHKEPGRSWEDAREAALDAAWEEAREAFSSDHPSIAILNDPARHLENLAKRAARRLDPLPLFDMAAIPTPAMIAPRGIFEAMAAAL